VIVKAVGANRIFKSDESKSTIRHIAQADYAE
jgi:hypothetical protein